MLGSYEEIDYFCSHKTMNSYSQYEKSSENNLTFLLRRLQTNDLGAYAVAHYCHQAVRDVCCVAPILLSAGFERNIRRKGDTRCH